ncbi:MAG: citrate synthase [Deltaproteobacteria bacterium]|nr:citrate synthase [Deltaproteobacteria bacterium]
MAEEKQYPNYSPGLEGVVAGVSKIARVDPEKQVLVYRGYDATELARKASFEEVAHLLVVGHLPSQAEYRTFTSKLRECAALPKEVVTILRTLPKKTHPMDALRTAISCLSGSDPDLDDLSHDANLRKAMRLMGVVPSVVAASWRILQGQEPIPADPKLSLAANFLFMLQGKAPDALTERVFNASLILYAEHGFNASTFACRVTASTLADIYCSVVAGIGTLKGSLHGGANEAAMETMLSIGNPAKAEKYVLDAIARKDKLMGFGHRVYKKGDSRVPTLKTLGKEYAQAKGDLSWYEMADTMERVMVREKNIYPNVDLPSAWIYYQMGIPIPLYTPIFAVARMSGWTAHVIEQLDHNRLIRPSSIYEGPALQPYVPLAERS